MQNTDAIADVWGSARRVVLSALDELSPRVRTRLAVAVIDGLAAARLLRAGIEEHYSAKELAALLGRSDEYIVSLIRRNQLSPVSRDGRGWLIPASTAQRWLDEHVFGKSTTFSAKDTGATVGKIP